jgi:hypothetical protein
MIFPLRGVGLAAPCWGISGAVIGLGAFFLFSVQLPTLCMVPILLCPCCFTAFFIGGMVQCGRVMVFPVVHLFSRIAH